MSRRSWKAFTREFYAPRWGAESRDGVDWYLAEVVDSLIAENPIDALEVGVGTGEPLAVSLLSKDINVVGVDISRDLAALSRQNALRRGYRVEAIEADAENLPFCSDQFDLVYSISSTWVLS